MADWRLAVDIGGTFTDIVLADVSSGRVQVAKTLTTPDAPLEGVRAGIMKLLDTASVGSAGNVSPADVRAPIVHATTLVTNALIEGKTGRAGLVTTSGFGDTLLIRDEHRYDMYDLQIEFPDPPVPRALTFEFDERTAATGAVLKAPAVAELDVLAVTLDAAGVESVAVCFLNSYVNRSNEELVTDHLARALGVPVCASAHVSPQIREYPRMVTAAANAATMPVLGPYLDELTKWLVAEGFGGSVLMMLSNGGVVSADDVARFPIRLVESGPAAGALAGSWIAKGLGVSDVLCFDMGGTTAKACLIKGGEPQLTNTFEVARAYRFKKGSGFPISVPSIDLVEVGAGGGSLASVDHFGLLKVGPESAGAQPGPASYGQGGTVATVTDADIVLGLIDPGAFLGGEMVLDASLAEVALRLIANQLDMSVVDTAAGVHEMVNQNMAAAARMHAVEMGVDLRGIPVIAFGGAGPVHACGVAELLEAETVVFPVNASVLSAFGTLVSPVRIDLARSLPRTIGSVDPAERDAVLDDLRAQGRRVLTAAGVEAADVVYRYGVDARYLGQGNEITIWVGQGERWPVTDAEVMDRFAAEYRRVYGLDIPDVPVEAVTWRLSASASTAALPIVAATDPHDRRAVPVATRSMMFGRGERRVEAPVFRRETLGVGAVIAGPAAIEERETTSIIAPGWHATIEADGSIVARRSVFPGERTRVAVDDR